MIRRHRRATFALAIAALTMLPALPAVAGTPTTRWVDDDGQAGPGGCDRPTAAATSIQDAVDASGAGDTVLVCPGRYVEAIHITGPRDGLTVRGVEPHTATVVLPSDSADIGGVSAIVEIEDVDRVRLQWLRLFAPTVGDCRTITNGVEVYKSKGFQVRALIIRNVGRNTLGNCGFSDGVSVDLSSGLIAYNLIRDFRDIGIQAHESGNVTIRRNSIRYFHPSEDTTDADGTGIGISETKLPRIVANVVRGLPTGGVSSPQLRFGISVSSSNAVGSVVRGNRVRHVTNGLSVCCENLLVETNELLGGADPDNGISIQATTSRFRDLRVSGFEDGIVISELAAGNVIRDNDFRGNTVQDCHDRSEGDGTGGTANTWIDNLGDTATPPEICD